MTDAFTAWRTQVIATAKQLDDIDYFALLGCAGDAPPTQLRKAFRQLAQTYHPDRFSTLDDDVLKASVHQIYNRITEAYAVLRHPEQKRAYQAGLSAGINRYDPERSAQALKATQAEKEPGQTERGKHHFKRAQAARTRGDLYTAKEEIKMAMLYEPKEPIFLSFAQELKGG
jgi:DnaJ-class molecular chaperone